MDLIILIVFFIVFACIDTLIIKYQIKKNIKLFYAIHRIEVIRILHETYPNSI